MTDQINTPVDTESPEVNAPQPPTPEVTPVEAKGVNESSEVKTNDQNSADSQQEIADDDQASPTPESPEPDSQVSESQKEDSESAISPIPQINDASSGPQTTAAGPTATQFPSISPIAPSSSQEPINIERLMDVNVNVTVELGRTSMPIKEVLDLQSGAVVELDRIAGEPVDIFINDRLLAQGEVVVIDDKFGVRVTELTGKKES